MPYIGEAKVVTIVQCRASGCHSRSALRQVWESSDGAYEDYHYECATCGHSWWIDGPDA